MAVQESIGTVMSASAALPATYDQTGYEALTYTAIGEVTEIPQHGGEADVIEHTPLATGIVNKFHGAIDYGSLTIPLGLSDGDAGQDIIAAAFASREAISFKVAYPDGLTNYFTAKCMSTIKRGASVGNVVSGEFNLELVSAIVEVAAS